MCSELIKRVYGGKNTANLKTDNQITAIEYINLDNSKLK